MTEAMPFLQKYDITFLRPPGHYTRGFSMFQTARSAQFEMESFLV